MILRRKGRNGCRGQAMIESIAVMLLTCICFFGIFQMAQGFADKTILSHAAARAARARTVGFNTWMVAKVARVAAIPAAGRRVTPASAGVDPILRGLIASGDPGAIWDAALTSAPSTQNASLERSLIPMYLDSINGPRAENILNYEGWDKMVVDTQEDLLGDQGQIDVSVRMRLPLMVNLDALREGEMDEGGEEAVIRSNFLIEQHAAFYLEPLNQ